jgi:protein O-mannosyl-transferase
MKTSRNQLLRIFVFLTLSGTCAIYSNFWNNGFHLDDFHTIETNLFVRSLSNFKAFFTDVKTFSNIPANASWRPIVTLNSAIGYWLGGGLNPTYFHLTTFVFFILQLIVMFYIFEKILKKSFEGLVPTVLAGISVAWYAFHPVCAETLNYIIACSDSLSTFFMLLAFWLYLKVDFFKKYFLYLIPLSIGAMAKPTALMFFPIVLVYEVLFNENKNFFNPKSYFSKNVMWVALPTGIFFVAMYSLIRAMEAETFNPGGASFFKYLISQPFVYLHYIQQFFYPSQLSAQNDYILFDSIAEPKAAFGILFLAVYFYVMYKTQFNPKTKPIAFGFSFFLCALIPTTFVPLAEVSNDHRMFFPFVGLVLAFITGCYVLYETYFKQNISYKFLLGAAVLCLSLYGFGTFQRNKVWLTEDSLWKDTTEKSPKNGLGWLNYGLTFMAKEDFKQAEAIFLRALGILPEYAPVYTNLGITYQNLKQFDKATQFFDSAIKCKYGYPTTHFFYARFKYQMGETELAIKHLYMCLKESPGELNAREFLIGILYDTEKFEELTKLCTETLKILPTNEIALSYLKKIEGKKSKLEVLEAEVQQASNPENLLDLSLEYYKKGNYQKCIETCHKVLILKPNSNLAYNNICSSYNALGEFDKAIEACNKSLEINPNYELAKNNLILAQRKERYLVNK